MDLLSTDNNLKFPTFILSRRTETPLYVDDNVVSLPVVEVSLVGPREEEASAFVRIVVAIFHTVANLFRGYALFVQDQRSLWNNMKLTWDKNTRNGTFLASMGRNM